MLGRLRAPGRKRKALAGLALCAQQGRAGQGRAEPGSPPSPQGSLLSSAAPGTPLQARQQTLGCSRSGPSSPEEPAGAAVSWPALTIPLNHGSETSRFPRASPDCTQDRIIKGFCQHLTPHLITFKSKCKIKIQYCFYQESPTFLLKTFLCHSKEFECPEASVRNTFKAENELSANNSCLAFLSLNPPLSLGYFYIGLLIIPVRKASKITLPAEVSHLPGQATPASCSLKSFLPSLQFPS